MEENNIKYAFCVSDTLEATHRYIHEHVHSKTHYTHTHTRAGVYTKKDPKKRKKKIKPIDYSTK